MRGKSFRISEKVEWKKLGDDSLLLLPQSSEFYKLNATATLIMDSLSKGCGTDEVVARILDEFDATQEEARSDLHAFLGEMTSKGVLRQSTRINEPKKGKRGPRRVNGGPKGKKKKSAPRKRK